MKNLSEKACSDVHLLLGLLQLEAAHVGQGVLLLLGRDPVKIYIKIFLALIIREQPTDFATELLWYCSSFLTFRKLQGTGTTNIIKSSSFEYFEWILQTTNFPGLQALFNRINVNSTSN